MENADGLRKELADLLARRRKPQSEWTAQDWLDQRAITRRIHHLQNVLKSETETEDLNKGV